MIVLLVATAAHIRAFESCLARQHFISDWMGELKLNKLSTGCLNELKGLAVEKVTNPVGGFIFLPASPVSLASDKTAMLRRLPCNIFT